MNEWHALMKGLLWLVLGFLIGSGLLYGHRRSEPKHADRLRQRQAKERAR